MRTITITARLFTFISTLLGNKNMTNMRISLTTTLLFLVLGSMSAQQQDSLHEKQITLDSLVVVGRQPVVKTRGNISTIRVKGSVLADMGSVTDMLDKVPGLTSTPEGIVVVGRGTPVYEIDGRIVQQRDMLKAMQANAVESLEIDRFPSATYPAGTKAVVRIKTIKHINDFTYLDVQNAFSVRRTVSGTPSLSYKYKKGWYTTTLTYMFSTFGNKNKETYYKDIIHPDYTFHSSEVRQAPERSHMHYLVWGNEFQLNKKNVVGFSYYGNLNRANDHEIGQDILDWQDSRSVKDIRRRNVGRTNTHSFSLYYNYDIDPKTRLRFTSDYAFVKSHHDIHLYEAEGTKAANTWTGTDGRYHVWTNNLKYYFSLFKSFSAVAGLRYEHTESPSEVWSDNKYLMDGHYYNHIETRENNSSAFIATSRKWGKLGAAVGLRYEYTHRTVSSKMGTDGQPQFAKQHYSYVYPTLSLTYTPDDAWNFYANYRRNIMHPTFKNINPTLTYRDSLSYEGGNVDLLSTIEDYVSIGANWKDLSLEVDYTYDRHPILEPEVCIAEGSNIVATTPLNLKYNQSLYTSLSYNKTFKTFDVYASTSLSWPYCEYVFNGQTCHAHKMQVYIQANCTCNLTKNWAFYTAFTYQGRNEYMTTYQKAVNKWNCGIRAKMLKGKLTANLEYADILHGANYNNLYDRYLNVTSGTHGTNDMRGIELVLSYNIFNKDIRTSGSRQNSEILQRIN